ncbi:hypothetical protein [Niveibacterium microcysteis]|uniref:HEPN domain-containing protein n=1 Tax=Niveibacterium microcysteis TaxID=2811415 RepID=A0ABX7M4I0_9RHOO|nr:hypothetical protein [Niveibacterium microcysteis]QSI76659.1 hypothetical protein JY500_19710 [Niveibacterium microcysteis]
MNPPNAIHGDETRTTPIGMCRYACEFMLAAIATDESLGKEPAFKLVPPIPVLFLVGQSIELSLKAFLLSRGVTLRKLRFDYGHNLHDALRKSKELGLLSLVALSSEELETIEILDDLYRTKQLQYIVTGMKTYPAFGPLKRAAIRLLQAIGTEVGYPPRGLPNVL